MQIIEVKNQLVSTIALIDDENKILISKRPVGKAFENLWEFPGGKVKKNETVEPVSYTHLTLPTSRSV